MLACNESWRSRISPSFSLGASACARQKTQKCCLAERSENGFEKKTWSIRIQAKLGVQWTLKLGIVIVGLKWCISRPSVSWLCKRENIRKAENITNWREERRKIQSNIIMQEEKGFSRFFGLFLLHEIYLIHALFYVNSSLCPAMLCRTCLCTRPFFRLHVQWTRIKSYREWH